MSVRVFAAMSKTSRWTWGASASPGMAYGYVSSFGRGVASGLKSFGASVAIWERNPESCAAAAEEIGALGIPTDVRDSAQVDAALAQTVAELGPVTILVNNAGGVFHSSILETSENGWDALYKSNLRHVYLCTQRVARGIIEQKLSGSIVSVTSIEGIGAAPGFATYAAAKAGVINYTKTAALELAPHGIRINALAPDITLTEGIMAIAPPGSEQRFGLAVPPLRPPAPAVPRPRVPPAGRPRRRGRGGVRAKGTARTRRTSLTPSGSSRSATR